MQIEDRTIHDTIPYTSKYIKTKKNYELVWKKERRSTIHHIQGIILRWIWWIQYGCNHY